MTNTTGAVDGVASGIRCGAGVSTQPDLEMAIQEATGSAARTLGAEATAADLAVVFVSSGYGHAIRPALEGLADAIGVNSAIGGTAEAILGNAG